MRIVDVHPTPNVLAEAAAAHIASVARRAIAASGRFTLALSGGSTPHETFRRLANTSGCDVDWSRVDFYWSDERCVPPNHPESNYGAAKHLLIDAIAVPAGNVHRMEGERDPADAAQRYESIIADALPFDLVLLGLGMDGHTASLFPESIAATVLAESNRERSVLAVYLASHKTWRLTLTPPVINRAREVLVLAFGGDKAGIVHEVLQGPREPTRLPAQLIDGAAGAVRWLLDAPAARLLRP